MGLGDALIALGDLEPVTCHSVYHHVHSFWLVCEQGQKEPNQLKFNTHHPPLVADQNQLKYQCEYTPVFKSRPITYLALGCARTHLNGFPLTPLHRVFHLVAGVETRERGEGVDPGAARARKCAHEAGDATQS